MNVVIATLEVIATFLALGLSLMFIVWVLRNIVPILMIIATIWLFTHKWVAKQDASRAPQSTKFTKVFSV